MLSERWICLTELVDGQRAPLLVRYDQIMAVYTDDDDADLTRVKLPAGFVKARESIRDVFLVPIKDTPLMALQVWEENA